jgi:stress response protein SCP2
MHKLVRAIDKNGDGRIDFTEFCEWVVQGDALTMLVEEDTFEGYVNSLMKEAGWAAKLSKMNVSEVQVRPDGLKFLLEGGTERMETSALTNPSLELTSLDPEEFICKIECNGHELILDMNTGRLAHLKCKGQPWGPWSAPDGFHIIGIRAKLIPNADSLTEERIVGVDLAPLPNAKIYDAPAALRFSAEHEFLQTLRGLLSKSAVNVNGFSPGGVTALMLAAQMGNTGSLQMLLNLKAEVDLADQDGWTALTFASRYGQTTCVNLLLGKGAHMDGDQGVALQQALRAQHNSAARALLRAGFGPAPAGTFALEDPHKDVICDLPRPVLSPEPAAYSEPVSVTIALPESMSAVAGTPSSGPQILYSVDGRDPMDTGRRYKGPLLLSEPRTHLRAVIVKGKERSEIIDAIYVVCHYAMPGDVITGTFNVRLFQQAVPHLKIALSNALDYPKERIEVNRVDSSSSPSEKMWLTVSLRDPLPRHRLTIDRPYTLVRGAKQKQQFIEAFTRDVAKGVGSEPTGIEISAGSIVVDFTLPRQAAEELNRQLDDPQSYLLSRAKSKQHFREARLSVVESLGDRLADPSIQDSLRDGLSKKGLLRRSTTSTSQLSDAGSEFMCAGSGDTGVIATLVQQDQIKALRKVFEKCVKEILPDCVQENVSEGPEELEIGYTIDVVTVKKDNARVDDAIVRKIINEEEVLPRFQNELRELGLPARVSFNKPPASRPLSQLEFRLRWDYPVVAGGEVKPIQDYLDAICMVYAESSLLQIVDFKSATEGSHTYDGPKSSSSQELCKAINRAIRHSGDDLKDTGGEHRMMLDLDALPPEATDIFFILATFETDDLSAFPNPEVGIFDASSNRRLTQYHLDSAGKSQAVIMCSLSRIENSSSWIVNGLGLPSKGNVRHYDEIRASIGSRQDDYLRWERRQDIVKLRAMLKTERLNEGSTNDYASFLWRVLKMPTPVFQLVTRWL